MPNFFSAFAIACRKIFSAFSVNVLACIKVRPYGFDGGGEFDEHWEEDGELGGGV
jgi:hypothetical protein